MFYFCVPHIYKYSDKEENPHPDTHIKSRVCLIAAVVLSHSSCWAWSGHLGTHTVAESPVSRQEGTGM